ncbi:MAG: hypothetical protein IVW55_09095 [Chloroflexi bacterium]|nr:hypothetical protein [Chloroflexota bacterium]
MRIRLTILSALEVLAFAGALVYFLGRIVSALESIGGSANSYLARLGYGVRAIDKETSYLAPQVTQLNAGLTTLAGNLGVVDGHLGPVAQALSKGKEGAL